MKGVIMATQKDYELAKAARKMMEEMFKVKKGETVILTADTGTDMTIVEGFAQAAYACGGKPLVMRVATPRSEGQDGVIDLPDKALTGALLHADVWIEFNSQFMLYSEIWETAMRENKNLRYLIIYDATIDQLDQIVNKVDVTLLGNLLRPIRDMLLKGKTIRVASKRGTDFTFELEPKHVVDMDDGNYDKPKFGTLPGYVNVVPKFGTMTGTIVFDEVMGFGMTKENPVNFKMKDGKIEEVYGSEKALSVKEFIDAFDDENMYKISHMMISLNPGIRSLTGSIVIDERIYGGIDLGFGHTSSIDAPPIGQPAKSHFDCILEETSIWIDDVQITDFGTVMHPDLKAIAEKLLNETL